MVVFVLFASDLSHLQALMTKCARMNQIQQKFYF